MRKRFLSMITAIVMLLSLLPQGIITVSAAMSGSGTMSAPYIITTAAELSTIGGKENKNIYFRLGNNITVDSSFNTIDAFYGVLDGNGKTITGVNITEKINSNGSVISTGRLFNTIEKNAIVYNLTLSAPKLKVDYTDVASTTNSYALKRGLFVNTNKGTLNNISLVSVNVDADVEGYNEVTQNSNLTVRELGVMVSRNSGEILNSNMSGTVTARNINLFGTVAYQNLPTGTVANIVSNVELKIVPINDNDMGNFYANSLGIAENRGYVYNLWALGTISGGNDRWYATNSSRYLCVYNSGTIENGYYKPSTGKFELSGAVNNSTPDLGTGTSSGIVEKSALDNSIYTSNQTVKANEIRGSGSGTLYTVEWRNENGTVLSRELCNAGSIKIPYTVDEDHYCETWKDSSNTTCISGSTYTVSGNMAFTAQNVQGKYYIAFDGEKNILPSVGTLPSVYPFVWKKIGSGAAEGAQSGVTFTKEIAKVGSDGKATDFASSYTGTISAGDKFCYRYIIESTTNDRVKLGTYKMYTENSAGVVTAASYKVEKITLTSGNYADYIDLTVPAGVVYLAEGGYNYPSATGKSGAAAVPTGAITLSYMDGNGNDVTGEPTEVGEYRIFLSLAADENFNEASVIDTGKTYKIDKATPSITANMQPTDVAYGDSITVTVDVKAKLKGDGTEGYISGGTVTLEFQENGEVNRSKTQTKVVNGASLEFTVTDLPYAGTACIVALFYSGDENYNNKTTEACRFIVGQAPSTTEVTFDKTSYTYGEDMIITVDAPQAADQTELTVFDIYDASANISFVEKNSDGKYVYKYTKPNGGDREIKAEYAGSTNYSYSSATATATVEKLQLTVTATPSASSYQYQDEVKIKLSVTGVPTGGSTSIRDFSIDVYNGDNIVSSMFVSDVVPFTDKEISLGTALDAGTYDIYVALDDDNYTVPMGVIVVSVPVARRAPVLSDFSYSNDFLYNTYDKTEKTVTITPKIAVAADMGTVTIEYRRDGEIVTAPVDAGWYDVYACVDDSGPNITEGTVEIVGYGIAKKTPDASDMTVKINDEAPLSEYPYTGKPVTATVTSADEGAFGVTAVSYYKKNSEGNYVLMSEEPTDGGSYKVKVTTAESTNYSAATDVEVAAFEIKKADPDITLTNSGAVYYYDSAITVAGGVYPKLSIYDTAKRPTGTLTAELIDTSDSSSKVLPADKVNFLEEYGSYDVTFEPKTDFSAGKIYKLKLTYGGDENYNTATLTSGNYEIAKSKVIFEVSDTEHRYSTGEAREIKVQPKIGGMSEVTDVKNMPDGGIVVKYYKVDENEGILASTTPVTRAVAAGRYMYVISLSPEASANYECYEAEYAVADTSIPDFAAYGNVGYMDIKSGNAYAQKPIYFDNAVVNAYMTDTVTNPLNNPNASTVTYKTSNEAVAEVDADTGTVTAKKPGTATITATSTKEGTTPVYASYTVTVRKELTIGDFAVTAEEKAYDGTDYVKVTAAVKTESLADSSDVVSVTAVAAFDEATAGVRTVNYEIVSISGKNADKYVLADNLTGTISGKITKAEVTIICSETTTRTYDGNAQAVDVSAMANGRVFDSTNYTIKYNGETAAVNVGSYPITVELNSDAAVNYEIKTQPNAVLVIKSASQEVFSIENVPDTVYYGDTFTVSTYGAAGDVTYSVSDNVDGKDIAAVDNSGNVAISGVGKVTITATSKKEGYIDRIAVKTFEVKKKILTPTATAEDRLYDGQNGVSVTVSLSGVLESDKDNITATASGSMINADAGNEKIVYVSEITLGGDKKDFYTLSSATAQTTVDIAPIEIDGFTVTSENKTYDGTDAAPASVTGINGVIEADKGQVSLIGTASYGSADVGEYNVTYTATGLSGAKAGNYKLITTEYTTTETYKIEAVEIAFTIGQTSFVYDGNDKEITVSASDKFGRVFKDYTVSYFDGENNAVTPNKSGNYTARITLNSTNYTTSQADVAVTITEATQDQLVIARLPGTVQYGDSFELEAYGGADGGEYKWEVVSGNADLSSDDAEKTTVSVTGIGKVELKVTKKCSNYSDISVKTVFAASPKNIAFEIGNLEQTYGNITPVTVTPSDENVTYEITYDGNTELPKNAGKYKVKVASTNENYSGNAAETLVINKGTASGSVNVNESYTYGDTVAATATGLTDGTTAEITYAGTGIYVPQLDAPKNAGSYTAIATITGANYETLTVTKEFKIEKAPLTVWASNAERAYGESNPVFTVEYDGFKYSEDKNVLLSEPIAAVNANASSPVGDYTITVSGGSAENYKFVYENTGKLTVTGTTGGQLVITGAANTVNVGQIFTLQAFYGNSKVNAEWKSDNTDVATIDENGIVTALKAGTVNITATADENYSNATATFTITVKQSNITLVPTETVKTYNGARQDISFAPNADFTPILSGEGKNVEVKYTLISDPSVTEPIQVGTYSVVYTIKDESFTGGGNTTMYINKATVKAKVKDDSKVYGDEYTNYDLEITDNGGLTEAVYAATLEDLKAYTTYASGGAAKTAAVKDGGYEIIPTLSQTETDNIKFSVEKGTLTVTKAPLTITVKNVSREYGAENPTLEAEYEGFKNEEKADVLTGELVLAYDESINAETAVGTYVDKTTASGLTSGNYEITFVPGNVTVTKIGVKASGGTSRSSYLTVNLDKSIAGLTANNFVVRSGDENIALTEVTASSDSKTYTLKGSFSTSVTYTVEISLEGTESDATHEIISEALSIKPSSGSSGKGGGGGSSTATTYTVTFETNGGNKINSVKVSKNGTLSKPTEPTKDGYNFDGWYSDKALKTAYDFDTKVTKSFTLYAKWTEKEIEPDKPIQPVEPTAPEWKNPFTDVSEDDWFYANVEYAVKNGLLRGTNETTFEPNGLLTRAMLVTVLYRAEGEPAVNKSIPFSDVDANAYYANAVIWAQQNGIVNGVIENEFAPDDNITREQIAAIMFRFAKYKGYDVSVGESTNILSYTDVRDISEYAIPAVQYAVGTGLMKGKTETTINPKDNATRAEVAAILQRFIEANK